MIQILEGVKHSGRTKELMDLMNYETQGKL